MIFRDNSKNYYYYYDFLIKRNFKQKVPAIHFSFLSKKYL